MRFDLAVDLYIADMRRQDRMRSDHTEAAYRAKLIAHAADVDNRDPSKTGRGDVKRTLDRWAHPNSRNQAHAILRSFYDWAMEEGIRETNPARQVRKAKARKAQVYRLTRAEALRLLEVARAERRDRWIAHLGLIAGLRSQEIRLLQGRHLARDGWVWVSADIGKGAKERLVPVLRELEPVVAEIRALVAHDAYVLPGRRIADPPGAAHMVDADVPQAASTLHKRVVRLGEKAAIAGRVTPHSLRHGFGDLIAKHAGVRNAQAAMGHASSETTLGTYMSAVSLDELALGFNGLGIDQPELSPADQPPTPRLAP